eukprot:TRINITY_DN272_c0_g2_i1.p1 TRINITY_DN272_c0_g2~~TRINITY_DN272_c0_g2_i1.p1  ORF type:complete len:222 (+),score=90.77 TRINITY_DN272_c0_g2_i1:22-687(+)
MKNLLWYTLLSITLVGIITILSSFRKIPDAEFDPALEQLVNFQLWHQFFSDNEQEEIDQYKQRFGELLKEQEKKFEIKENSEDKPLSQRINNPNTNPNANPNPNPNPNTTTNTNTELILIESEKKIQSDATQPLFISETGQPSEFDILNCSKCNSKRVFEFQLMPQLLYNMNIERTTSDVQNSVDWGTLLVYTCSKSCNSSSIDSQWGSYSIELLWKQMID